MNFYYRRPDQKFGSNRITAKCKKCLPNFGRNLSPRMEWIIKR